MFSANLVSSLIIFAQSNFNKVPDPNFGQRSSDITKDGAVAADLIAKSFDQLWQDTFKGQLYASIANVGALFALGTLLIFMVQWTKTMLEGNENKALSEMIWPLIVIFLLSGHGKNLASVTLSLRGIIQQTNQTLLETTSASIRLQEAYQEVMKANGDADAVRQYQIKCEAKSSPKEEKECYENSIQKAEELVKDAKSKHNNEIQEEGGAPWDQVKNLLKKILEFRQSVVQIVMRGVLFGIAAAFQWVIEISLLVTGLLGPLAVGGSLLPIGKKPIIAWLTAFFSIGLVKICYNMISGLVAIIMFTSNVFDSMIFPIIIGLFAPILSLALAAGGGLSILNGMSNVASSGVTNLSMLKNLNRK